MQTVALEGVRGGVDMRAKCGNGGAEWGWQGGGGLILFFSLGLGEVYIFLFSYS